MVEVMSDFRVTSWAGKTDNANRARTNASKTPPVASPNPPTTSLPTKDGTQSIHDALRAFLWQYDLASPLYARTNADLSLPTVAQLLGVDEGGGREVQNKSKCSFTGEIS